MRTATSKTGLTTMLLAVLTAVICTTRYRIDDLFIITIVIFFLAGFCLFVIGDNRENRHRN